MSHSDVQSEVQRLRSLIDGHQVSQAIHVAATLGLADLLRDGPRSVDELARETGTHERSLYRLMRALASIGVFREEESRVFRLSPMGELLRTDVPASLAGWAVFTGRPYFREAWGNLLHSIQTGETAFGALHGGQRIWQWRASRPEESAIFDRAMKSLSGAVASALAEQYDFGRFTTIVDVGGGNGSVLAAVLARAASLRGTVFDLPHVVTGAPELLASSGVADRCDVVGGDFFVGVPAGADAYMLKSVLHDWEDESAIRILQNVRAVCSPASALLVVERVVGPPNESAPVKFSDLNMLVAPGGEERTREEWATLFGAAGFRMAAEHDLGVGWSVIEGAPA